MLIFCGRLLYLLKSKVRCVGFAEVKVYVCFRLSILMRPKAIHSYNHTRPLELDNPADVLDTEKWAPDSGLTTA